MSFQERFKGKITTMPKEGITKLQIEKPDNSNKNSFNQPLNSSKKSYDSQQNLFQNAVLPKNELKVHKEQAKFENKPEMQIKMNDNSNDMNNFSQTPNPSINKKKIPQFNTPQYKSVNGPINSKDIQVNNQPDFYKINNYVPEINGYNSKPKDLYSNSSNQNYDIYTVNPYMGENNVFNSKNEIFKNENFIKNKNNNNFHRNAQQIISNTHYVQSQFQPQIPENRVFTAATSADNHHYQSEKKLTKNFKPYTLREYQEIKQINSYNNQKGLGPNIGSEDWQMRKMKKEKMDQFAKQVDQFNRENIVINEYKSQLEIKVSKTQKMKEFSKNIPKPKVYFINDFKPTSQEINQNNQTNINYLEQKHQQLNLQIDKNNLRNK